jgi:leader peptidase (prepilin peptidase)/N-methyltransferase
MSPTTIYGGAAASGALLGAIASRLVDVLPPRYGITHLVTGSKRTKRNVTIVLLATACGVALAHRIVSHPAIEMHVAAWYFATSILLLAVVIAGSAIDFEHMILPDELTLGGALVAVALSHFGIGIVSSLIGAGVGLAAAYLPHLLYRAIKKQSGQGAGDVKLVVLAGAWLGPLGAVFVLLAGAIQSMLAAVVMRVTRIQYGIPESVRAEIDELRAKAKEGDAEAKAMLAADPMALDVEDGVLTTRLPLGPFLALACAEYVFAKDQIVAVFDRFFAP